MTSITLLLILAATAALAWAGTGLIIRNAVAWGLEDVPNERSSHTRVTPRGGGAAIVAASLAGFLLLTLAVVTLPHLVGLGQPLDQGTFASLLAQDAAWLYSLGPLVWIALPLLLAALVLGILGLQDDRQPLSIRLRLGFQLFCCAWLLVVLSSLPGAGSAWAGLKEQLWQLLSGWGLPGMSETFTQAEARDALLPAFMTLGLVVALMLLGTWWINLYNFMDGIDGIAASQALFMLLAGVLLRSLMRDAGSLFLGFSILAVAGLDITGHLTWLREAQLTGETDVSAGYGIPVTSWMILGALFITDATVTLLRRLLSGQRVGDAHRSHAYQRLSRHWNSHARVTLVYCLINVLWLLPLAALARLQPGQAWHLVALAYLPLIIAAYLLGAGRKEPVS